jgi:hypothetical protein
MRLFFMPSAIQQSAGAPETPAARRQFRHLRNLDRLRFCFLVLSLRAADLILAT